MLHVDPRNKLFRSLATDYGQRGGGEYAVTAGSEAAGTDFRFQLIVRYNNILEFRLAAKNLPPWLNL